MNPFVHPHKRSILLPPGCKDLRDALLGTVPEPDLPETAIEFLQLFHEGPNAHRWVRGLQPDLVSRQGLDHVGRYVGRLCACPVDANLYIGSFSGDLGLLLTRRTGQVILYPLEGLADRADAVKDFFDDLSIQPLLDATMDYDLGGAWMRIAGYPIPGEAALASRTTVDLIQQVGRLPPKVGLGFTYVEDQPVPPRETSVN